MLSSFISWLTSFSFWCHITGHRRTMEDIGGCIVECCHRCPWTGRYKEYDIEYERQVWTQ